MWYLKKVTSSCEQFSSLSTSLCPKYMKFCFQNLWNSWENKIEVDRLLLIFDHEQNVPIYFATIELFSISKPKTLFLSSLAFPKFWKQHFMYFGHEHVET